MWLLSYAETAHAVKMRGGAKSDEDVAEFLKRLKQSAFFSDVYWQQTQPQRRHQAQRLLRHLRRHGAGELLMQNFFDKIASMALGIKLGIVVGAVVLLTGGYYYFFYSDMQDELAQLQKDQEKLQREKKDYEKRKQEYLAFRNEVNALLDEQKELLRVLPKRDDIEQFIENVQAQIELTGLTKVSSVREAAQPVEMYMKIPVKMSLHRHLSPDQSLLQKHRRPQAHREHREPDDGAGDDGGGHGSAGSAQGRLHRDDLPVRRQGARGERAAHHGHLDLLGGGH